MSTILLDKSSWVSPEKNSMNSQMIARKVVKVSPKNKLDPNLTNKRAIITPNKMWGIDQRSIKALSQRFRLKMLNIEFSVSNRMCFGVEDCEGRLNLTSDTLMIH